MASIEERKREVALSVNDQSTEEEAKVNEDAINRSNGGDNDHMQQEKVQQKGGMRTMPFIFGNEITEKIAGIGFGANMVIYLTQELHMGNVQAATTHTNFAGTASLMPLLGAFLADSYIGRFWTITTASLIYCLGMFLLTLAAVEPRLHPPPCSFHDVCQGATKGQLALVFGALTLTVIGAGGIRPCVAAFGADQFEHHVQAPGSPLKPSDGSSRSAWGYFNWYYFCMGASALVAVTVIVWIQDNVGWGLGFGIPAALMLLSTIFFLLGARLYAHSPLAGSPFTRLARVVVATVRKRHLPLPCNTGSTLYELSGKKLAFQRSATSRLNHTSQFRFLDRAAVRTDSDMLPDGNVDAWRLCTVTEVEELKVILRMFPIWAAGILLVTASAQQGTFSVLQARTMDRHLSSSFLIPPSSMVLFSITSMLLTITVYDRLLMPIARRVTGHPRGITFLQRMSVGFVLSTVATLVAALVEIKRKHVAARHGMLNSPLRTIPIPVFWLVPQYSLHGIAEAFMAIGHLEFFYDQAPESMRSTATALFWTSSSIGNYFSSFLVSMIKHSTSRDQPWLPSNLNHGHLDYFYWLLTLLQLLNLLFFFISARWYRYKPVAHESNLDDAPSKVVIDHDDDNQGAPMKVLGHVGTRPHTQAS